MRKRKRLRYINERLQCCQRITRNVPIGVVKKGDSGHQVKSIKLRDYWGGCSCW